MVRAGLDKIIVVDLETTCEDETGKRLPREVIEVGVCFLDIQAGDITERQSILVRPVFSKVSDFCTKLTTLTQKQVESGIPFAEACALLEERYKTKRRVWASYGDFDRNQFERECRLKGIPYPFGPRHINVKTLFAIRHRLTQEVGMDEALCRLGLELIGTHHRGVDDAYNVARILYTLI
ncbi:MAG: exonuclease domain-containing protein [Deltaproteobacteria bacterium]|nr:exonuclease domain-containing protein [Deltaproteobacteria bacterium]